MKPRITACILCSLCLTFFISGCGTNKTPGDSAAIFGNANELYKKGNYDLAIVDYEKILNKGYESGDIYYNIGNCYFKKNKLGKAIVNYKRALRLEPRDGDIRSNYKFAFSTVKRNVFAPQKIFFLRFLGMAGKNLTVNEAAIIFSAAFCLLLVNILLYISYIPTRRFFVISTLAILIVMVASGYFVYKKAMLIEKEAIVLTEDAYARFEPFDRATTHFTLYEGEEVLLLERMDSWCKIKRVDGKIGWVPSDSIEVI